MKIKLANIINDSIVDGPGIRLTVFFQGCNHHCEGCFNKSTWDFNNGYLCDISDICEKIKNNPLLSGITLSGGDPLFQVDGACELIKKIKQEFNHLNIIVYTGFLFEQLIENSKTNKNLDYILHNIDYLVDGKFDISKKDLSLKYRGSSNQRIINTKLSLEQNKIITEEF